MGLEEGNVRKDPGNRHRAGYEERIKNIQTQTNAFGVVFRMLLGGNWE